MLSRLSPILVLNNDIDTSVETAYTYFKDHIQIRENRPKLFDKEVFIEAHEWINNKPEGFWHIISLEDNHHFKVLPCVNDDCIDLCSKNCITPQRQIVIKMETEVRNVCLLRASRLPWIIDIINLANNNDPDIKRWCRIDSKRNEKLYLRYKKGYADYILIFSVEKKFYRLISAFPVFYISEKDQFDKDYSDYHKQK